MVLATNKNVLTALLIYFADFTRFSPKNHGRADYKHFTLVH